ncbi:hypothetical protein CPB85DRAFT_1266911 [Mucidula mucida]|nr:hypothetical protein CPB85DRAFT_1266911 [Mucidula mucida]
MAPTIASAFSDFTSGVMSIIVGLFNSVLAFFYAILALGKDIVGSVIQLGQSFVKLGIDVFQGVLGFATANFIALAVIGGGYYYYTTQQKRKRGTKRK